jgi:hypothetical protein
MALGSSLDMDLLDEDKNLREIDDDEHGAFVSALAGIGSGLFKIPEQFVSLGAELIDLGLDTDTAASVESFFDKINPFDEIAESTTAGKLTETFVSLGIPTTAGYSLASRLAGKALKAKRLNQYVDLKRFGNAKTLKERKEALRLEKLKDPVTGKRRRVNDALLEEVERLSPPDLRKRVFKDKAYVFSAGLGGGGLADFVFADPDIGTLGDMLKGTSLEPFAITMMNREDKEGREEAFRRLTNRVKFAVDGS